MIKGTVTIKCDELPAPLLAERIKSKILGIACPDHGEKASYEPATGASFDKATATYRGECSVKVTCCCQKLLNAVRVNAM